MNEGSPSIHVWQDNETDTDLLGFQVHVDLIRSVITDPTVLPVTVGVFGDWGGGKSSIMRMLQNELLDEAVYPNVLCLYFNGWTFEGYEDAKSALLSSILIQLGEHKRFGPKARDWVVKLLKRIKWMEVAKLGVKHVGIPVAVAATGGLAAVPVMAAVATSSIVSNNSTKDDNSKADSDSDINWSALVDASPEKPDLIGVRKFRGEFSKLLEETEISTLVVLIDDLDRCLPERLIETLEAIKLFVSVPRTAFVIGADPRIVRHAISTRYVKRQFQPPSEGEVSDSRREEDSLVQNYLEKLIQVPYQLPRLSPSEIETYINLLACEKLLDSSKSGVVISAWRKMRAQNVYAAFTGYDIQRALDVQLPAALKEQLDWSRSVAPVLTEGLKGNPRQVKRMLNAISLRKQLASAAGISIKEEVLAKLMVLEYSNLSQFHELNQWQAAEKGVPEKLKTLEEQALQAPDGQIISTEDTTLKKWHTPSTLSWLRMRPPLSGEDLRDYFWLARDRTGFTLTGVSMVPPSVQIALRRLLSNNAGEKAMGTKSALTLSDPDKTFLLDMLKQEAERHPDRATATAALHKLAIQNMSGAGSALIEAARIISPASLQPSIPQNIAELAQHDVGLLSSAISVLKEIANHDKTKAGKAASKALVTLQKKV